MILCVDVGNSHTVMGIWDNETLLNTYRIPTIKTLTIDNWYSYIYEWLVNILKISVQQKDIKSIFASVVPEIDNNLSKALYKLTSINVLQMNTSLNLPFTFNYPTPETLGADRLANAVAGVLLYHKNIIIIDFGTAITFCLILNNIYQGGAIVPGFSTALKSLQQNTSKLPQTTFNQFDTLPGQSTISSIQAGIYYGWQGLLSNIIDQLITFSIENKHIINRNELKIIATGGIVEDLLFSHEMFDIIDRDLTLKGLFKTYQLNTKI